jgi:radical SAM superfamily enzyme YgiQ (UPF0313 family)
MRGRYSFPLDHIIKEVELNAKNGTRMIILASEDIFLYQCNNKFLPNHEAIVKLIKSIAAVPGVEFIQPAHAALAPVVYDPGIVEEIGQVLYEKAYWVTNNTRHSSVEVGMETGSVRLMKKYMPGKMLPYQPEEWHDVVTKAVEIMNENHIWPLATLIVGLPEETDKDTIETLELLGKLKHNRLFYVPLLFTSEDDCMLKDARHMDLKYLTPIQWELLATCWRHNLKFFAPDYTQWPAKFVALLSYVLYYRWKHGRKALRPLMKLTGMTVDYS